MRKLIIILMCTIICTVSVFASDVDIIDDTVNNNVDITNNTVDNSDNVNYNNDDIKSILQTIADKIPETPDNGTLEVEPYSDTELRQLRISANDTSGLHSIFLRLIGDYNPIVKDYTYQSSNGYIQHSIEITPDYSWLASALLFIVVLFCTFKFLGGIISNV